MAFALAMMGLTIEIITGTFILATENRDDVPTIKTWSKRIFCAVGIIALMACLVMGE